MTETHVFDRIYVLPPTIMASVKRPYPLRAVNCVLLSKGQYLSTILTGI